MSLSVDDRQLIHKLIGEGHPSSVIARKVGCSASTIYKMRTAIKNSTSIPAITVEHQAATVIESTCGVQVVGDPFDWLNQVPRSLSSALTYLENAYNDPDADHRRITAVSQSVQNLAKVQYTLLIIKEKFGGSLGA